MPDSPTAERASAPIPAPPGSSGGAAPVAAPGRQVRRGWMRSGLANPGLWPFVFLAPAVVFLATFVFYPAVRILWLSFQDYSFVTDAVWVGFENYARLVGDEPFRYALMNSFIYLLVTPVLVVLALGVALLLDTGARGVTFFRSLYFLPVVTPMIVVGILWGWLLNEDVGLVNYAIVSMGGEKVPWLTEYPLNLVATMGVTAWKGLGYFAVIFLAGLAGVPKELEEAAALDGANAWQRLWNVKVPTLRPQIALVSVISSISALKVFDELYVMIPGAPAAEKTLVPLIYQTAFLDFRLGYASAISVVLFVVTLAFSLVNLRMWEKDGPKKA